MRLKLVPALNLFVCFIYATGTLCSSFENTFPLFRNLRGHQGHYRRLLPRQPLFGTDFTVCPQNCSHVGADPNLWSFYPDIQRLSGCQEPLALDFSVHTALNDSTKITPLRACVVDASIGDSKYTRHTQKNSSCGLKLSELHVEALWRINTRGAWDSNMTGHAAAAAHYFSEILASRNGDCQPIATFYRSPWVAAGFLIGRQLLTQDVSTSALQRVHAHIQHVGFGDRIIGQVCDVLGLGSEFTMGIVITKDLDLTFVQHTIKAWAEGKCVPVDADAGTQTNVTFLVPNTHPTVNTSTTNLNSTLRTRSDCLPTQVMPGESCDVLPGKCGISLTDFLRYNSFRSDDCYKLQAGQHVCCSAGSLPDFSPKSNPDGSCASYIVPSLHDCSTIAHDMSITIQQIEDFNSQTWGWRGCENLWSGFNMCVSSGSPPMPAPLNGAVCGPQVPGTKWNHTTKLEELNPCPLNACCTVWGQCGSTHDFCTDTKRANGAPGTAANNTNGCISNCVLGVVISNPPAKFLSIGYFQGDNGQRPCDNMNISNVDFTKYTHTIMSFATITSDFKLNISDIQDQFEIFLTMNGTKKMISIGGWAFSTDPATASRFRDSMSAANRATFISNLVLFLEAHSSIEGFDFDWEYPGADMPGLPPGTPRDGIDYLSFIQDLRRALPTRALSIATPSTYWNLQHFQIREMMKYLDFTLYMTYDYSGQWNYGEKDSVEGCPNGNCLRAHGNLTETVQSLAMITKAGVPSYKVIPGLANYGRSFQMTDPNCNGPMCTFTGPLSGAIPGECTNTPGVLSNQEIVDKINRDPTVHVINSNGGDYAGSDVMMYGGDQWVGFMSPATKAWKTDFLQTNFHVGGVFIWSIDLESNDNFIDDSDDSEDSAPICDLSLSFKDLADVERKASQYTPYCNQIYAVKALEGELDIIGANFTSLNSSYDSSFRLYEENLRETLDGRLQDLMLNSGTGVLTYNGTLNQYFNCTAVNSHGQNVSTTRCPFFTSDKVQRYDVYHVLIDPDGFYNATEQQGVLKDWIAFEDFLPPVREILCGRRCTQHLQNLHYHGFPREAANFNIPNPKDQFLQAWDKVPNLRINIQITYLDRIFGQSDESGLDELQVLSMPINMLEESLEAMKNAKDIGVAIEKEKKKALIETILSAVFAILPVLGELADVADLAVVADLLITSGDIANFGMATYDSVQDPSSAVLQICGALMGGVGGITRDGKSFKSLATKRREMTDEETANLGGLGTRILKQAATIKKIVKSCEKE